MGDCPDSENTPLHDAASRGYKDDVRDLVARGVNTGTKNAAGKTAAEIATSPDVAALASGIVTGDDSKGTEHSDIGFAGDDGASLKGPSDPASPNFSLPLNSSFVLGVMNQPRTGYYMPPHPSGKKS